MKCYSKIKSTLAVVLVGHRNNVPYLPPATLEDEYEILPPLDLVTALHLKIMKGGNIKKNNKLNQHLATKCLTYKIYMLQVKFDFRFMKCLLALEDKGN